jgi:hypothetical protein
MPGPKTSHSSHINGRAKRLRPGQPALVCKLDDRLEAKFRGYVKDGLPYESCAALCGISKQTFYSWRNRGESEPDSRYGQFAQAVERANAEAMRRLHNTVKATNPLFILERRWPQHYGPPKLKTETELTGGITMEQKGKFELTISCTGEVPTYPIVDSRTLQPINGAATGNGTNGNHDSTR